MQCNNHLAANQSEKMVFCGQQLDPWFITWMKGGSSTTGAAMLHALQPCYDAGSSHYAACILLLCFWSPSKTLMLFAFSANSVMVSMLTGLASFPFREWSKVLRHELRSVDCRWLLLDNTLLSMETKVYTRWGLDKLKAVNLCPNQVLRLLTVG